MNKKTVWLVASWLIVAALVMASCNPTATEVEVEESSPLMTEEEESPAIPITPENGNYSLQATSPCRGTGLWDNRLGTDNNHDDRIDMGAFIGTSLLLSPRLLGTVW